MFLHNSESSNKLRRVSSVFDFNLGQVSMDDPLGSKPKGHPHDGQANKKGDEHNEFKKKKIHFAPQSFSRFICVALKKQVRSAVAGQQQQTGEGAARNNSASYSYSRPAH